ncbi:F0F1 ATP synthase assembly protein I [Methylopila sp. M107]|uniref:AtpZ/AtpI family protein n=1 Tax=Methylopila sp. M107 TaxID=1101190 RepID=UPI000366C694|nr:F0F1 ATP synthase assembly protein I [Methylopila sp. M107]
MSQGSDRNSKTSGSQGDGDLSGRLDRLDKALKRRSDLDGAEGAGTRNSRSDAQGLALALRLGSEFIAAVIVGGAIGWGIDHFAGSSPWGLIVFLLLGFVAGVLNVLRSAGLVQKPGD